MDALSLKGFFTIAAVGALLTGLATGTYCVLTGHLAAEEVALAAVGSVMAGLFLAACCYLVQWLLDIRNLRLHPEELRIGEELVGLSAVMVHYRTGDPKNIWDAVGGKLALTNQRLVFMAHRGQPWRYRVELPLAEIAGVEECAVRGMPGGLRVTTAAGKVELFTFGGVRAAEATQWAEAIRRQVG